MQMLSFKEYLILYDKKIIHDYLEDSFMETRWDELFFREFLRNNWVYDRIADDIHIGNKTYKIGNTNTPTQFKKSYLTIEAQTWLTFILHNITLKINTSLTILPMHPNYLVCPNKLRDKHI